MKRLLKLTPNFGGLGGEVVLVTEGIVEEEVDGPRPIAFPQFPGFQSKLVDQLSSAIKKKFVCYSFSKKFYRVFQRFGQAKFTNSGSILSSSQHKASKSGIKLSRII
jgi:hypothetical protein